MSDTVFPERLGSRLTPDLPPSIAERLLVSPRLGARVRAWVTEGGAEAVTALPEADRALGLATSQQIRQAATLAGAVWHADRVRGLVLARDLQAFTEAHGQAARSAALSHTSPVRPSENSTPLHAAVTLDGAACLAAWLDDLPADAAAYLRLRLPLEAERPPDALHREHGPGLIRTVAPAAIAAAVAAIDLQGNAP